MSSRREYKVELRVDLVEEGEGIYRIRLPRVIQREHTVLLILDETEEVRYMSADKAIEIARKFFLKSEQPQQTTLPENILSELNQLRAELQKRDEEIKKLQRELEQRNREVEDLKKKLAEKEARIRELEQRLAQVTRAVIGEKPAETKKETKRLVTEEECAELSDLKPEDRMRLEEEVEKGNEEAALRLAKYVACSSTPVAISRPKAREKVKEILERAGYSVIVQGSLISVVS